MVAMTSSSIATRAGKEPMTAPELRNTLIPFKQPMEHKKVNDTLEKKRDTLHRNDYSGEFYLGSFRIVSCNVLFGAHSANLSVTAKAHAQCNT